MVVVVMVVDGIGAGGPRVVVKASWEGTSTTGACDATRRW